MMDRRLIGALAGAIGTSAAAAVGLRVVGSRIRARQDPHIDELLVQPPGVRHHTVTTSDGGSIHVASVGEGRPIVLLHGVVLQWWVWNPILNLLGSDRRVLAWDMRGHGLSRAGTDGITMEACARDLEEVLDALELDDAIVVGHSMGGMVLGRYLVDRPDSVGRRLSGAMFVASAATEVTFATLTPFLGAAAGVLAGLVERSHLSLDWLWKPGNLSASVVRVAFGRHPSAAAIEATREMVAVVPEETSIEAGQAILAHDLTESLGSYDGPARVVVGTDDRLTPVRLARRIAQLLPQADLVVLDGIGHQVMAEAPRELSELIVDFALRHPTAVSESAGATT